MILSQRALKTEGEGEEKREEKGEEIICTRYKKGQELWLKRGQLWRKRKNALQVAP